MGGLAILALAALQTTTSWEPAPAPDALTGVEIRSVATAADGSVWFGVRDRGLARLDGPDIVWMAESDGLMSSGVSDLLFDDGGRLWAVGLGGYAVREGPRWEASAAMGSITPRVIFGVWEDPRTGSIWMGANGGAGQLSEGRWRTFGQADGLPHQVVHAVVEDAEGTVWFACRSGLARLRDGAMAVLFPDTNFRSILEGPDGTLWFGTSDGVVRRKGGRWIRELRGVTLYPRLIGSDGSIWAGSAESGVLRHDGEGWRSVSMPEAFAGAEVHDLDEATDGTIWVASSRGALRLIPDPTHPDDR